MHASGDILLEIGDASRQIFPRSSCKMLQALPLIESGAAREHGLSTEQLALACASHNGEDMHTTRVTAWLAGLGLDASDLRCGPQPPARKPDQLHLHDHGEICNRTHNNCSGKHSGFLTLNKHLGGNSEYHELDHPVQKAAKTAFEEMTDETSQGYGIDGCGAPNFMSSLQGLARAMATFSKGAKAGGARGEAMEALAGAMMQHPLLVAGTNRACSELMTAANGKAAIKYGAEAVYTAILPERQIGIALKIEDGGQRGAECAIAALLTRLGVVDQAHPAVKTFMTPKITNFANDVVGDIRPSAELWQSGQAL